MPTIARTLEIAQPSCYLAANYREKGKVFGGYGQPSSVNQSHLIYAVYKILSTVYANDPTKEGLQEVSDYLYELCMKFAFKAAQIVDGGGGGSVTPITPSGSSLPNPYDWIVGSVTTADAPLKADDTSIYLNGTNGTRDFRGYNVEFYRGSQPDYTTNPGDGSVYYNWNRVTGLFTLFGAAAQLGEPMRITPVLGIATETPSTDPTTVTYNLTQATEIANLDNSNLMVSVIIIPNGFTYTWASNFVFTDNYPEQPGAIGAGTTQVYTFMQINSKWICFNQTLNGVV